jgi:D-glycero-alpha-D-manno-heptose-7-phosphate kinase
MYAYLGEVVCERVTLAPQLQRRLNENLLLFFTGITRQASAILGEQHRNINGRRAVLLEMKQLAYTARTELVNGNLDTVGCLLHESWLLKKQLAGSISNGTLDATYEAACCAGAIGGKITGAGGGGFLMLYCPEDRQPDVRAALERLGLQQMRCAFEFEGTRVLLHTNMLHSQYNWTE